MATQPALSLRQAGQEWLLSCAEHTALTQKAWDADNLAPIPTGTHWRVAEAPLAESMDAVKRIGQHRVGPVLADVTQSTAWWLLPPDLGDELDDVRQLTVYPAGWVLGCPPALFPVRGRVWMERPDGSGRLTDPTLLGAAFGPGGPQLPAEAFG
ncbi:hypothetical protein [Streptomyces phaeochromogenes]|uniref:hypothetical protein n=1 Tax=Streptomyces phaeochromogenes TaxID=1923 RepID=UPI003862D807|nr:hypothetical protein OG277_29270 [Streptomyces phaeochromogenes]